MGSVPSSAPRSAGPVSVFVTQRLIGDAPPPLGDATPSSRPASHGLCHFTESRTIDARGNTSRTWSVFDPTTSTRTTYHQRPESSHLAISEETDGVGIFSESFSAVTNRWSYEQQRDLLTQVRNEAHGGVISQDDYTYDAAGRRVSQTRSGTAMSETRNQNGDRSRTKRGQVP